MFGLPGRLQFGAQTSCHTLGVLQLLQPPVRLVPVDHHVGQGGAVAAAQVGEQGAAFGHLGQAGRILPHTLGEAPQLGGQVDHLFCEATQPGGLHRKWLVGVQMSQGLPQRLSPGPIGAQQVGGGRRRLTHRGRSRQQALGGLEVLVLVGIAEPGGVQRGHLMRQNVQLAGPGAFVASQRRQPLLEFGAASPCLTKRCGVDAGEPVEGTTAHRGAQQRLMVVLAADIHPTADGLLQRTHPRQVPIEIRPGTALDRHNTAYDQLGAVLVDEPALHFGLRCAGADQPGIAPPTGQQRHRLRQ